MQRDNCSTITAKGCFKSQFINSMNRISTYRPYFFIVIFTCCLFSINTAFSQQNFFNVPASEITPKKKIFFQQQFNVFTYRIQSNSHFCYGLGKGLEVGFNVSHIGKNFKNVPQWEVNYSNVNYPFSPLLLATAQYRLDIHKHFGFSIGTQSGFNIASRIQNKRFTTFTYGNLYYHNNPKHIKFTLGGFYADQNFLGKNTVGIMAGFEVPIIAYKIHLMGDFISGNHPMGASVVGVNVFFSRFISLCAGPILPNPNSNNSWGGVIELNILQR